MYGLRARGIENREEMLMLRRDTGETLGVVETMEEVARMVVSDSVAAWFGEADSCGECGRRDISSCDKSEVSRKGLKCDCGPFSSTDRVLVGDWFEEAVIVEALVASGKSSKASRENSSLNTSGVEKGSARVPSREGLRERL
jgi:hypothetical protein